MVSPLEVTTIVVVLMEQTNALIVTVVTESVEPIIYFVLKNTRASVGKLRNSLPFSFGTDKQKKSTGFLSISFLCVRLA